MGIRIYVVEEKAVPKDILGQLFLMIIALWISVFVSKSIYWENRRYKLNYYRTLLEKVFSGMFF
ncbi:hypothetical protein COM24_00195 [Bacillus toyonensis]|nr:hypothetical protein [Bacillus toyonensis biovar Thuringiensis]PEC41524.1 hypothetical protein CON60_01375 [Bacillus toyonensis]PEC67175.1 hypothetical protein CON62_11335 [Bacillus toyonensis]PED62364.1 hypothetical protein CON89_06250 [Bacillus toyonensis]PED99133.1 hypothetical protein CON78_19190 [Bacillus toyonensis]